MENVKVNNHKLYYELQSIFHADRSQQCSTRIFRGDGLGSTPTFRHKQTEAMIIMIAMAVEYLELCYLWLYYYVVLFFLLLLSTHILVYNKRKLTGASIHTVAG